MTTNSSDSNSNLMTYVKTKWGTEPPSVIVERIANGHRLSTEALGLSPNAKYRSQVVQAGAVDKLLEFLLKTDQPLSQVLPNTSVNDNDNNNDKDSEALIQCPSIWLNVLANFCQDGFLQPQSLCRDIQYKIVINMAALFQDMSNFEKRELFQSKDTWIKCLMFFTNMLYSLLSSNFGRIGSFLLRQQHVLKVFLIRTMFLEMSDPSIAKEIVQFSQERDDRAPAPDILGLSRTFAASSIKVILVKTSTTSTTGPKNGDGAKQQGGVNMTLVEDFANTPIRPEHKVRFINGLLPLLSSTSSSTTSISEGWYQGGYSATLGIFMILYDKADRLSGPFGVDSASEVMVRACRNHLFRTAPFTRDRFFVENILTGLVAIGSTLVTPNIGGKQVPMDYNVAKAIRAGLFDYACELCDANDPRIATALEGLIRTAAITVILDDTQKALQELAPAIAAKVDRVKDRHPLLLPPLAIIEEILANPMIKASASEDSDRCAFCQEPVTKETTQKCPFCKTIVYCSKDCQRLNWMIHQSTCAEKRKEPLAQTPETLMDQGKKLFALHISKMLLQASLKGYTILDCVVTIDMCEVTPLLKTYTLEQFSSMYIQDEDAVTLSEKVMARNKGNGALTVSFVGFSETEGFHGNLMTFPPEAAPLLPGVVKAIDSEKWVTAQRIVTASSLGQGAGVQMQKNPRLWQGMLMKTMKP